MTRTYTVGVMTMEVEGRDSAEFAAIVERAVTIMDRVLAREPRLQTKIPRL